jgi:hypothetical protein
VMFAAGIWFALSLAGFVKHLKENLFMAVWFALSIFPLLGSFFMPWYFLPVMPAIAFFAASALLRDGKRERVDAFFAIVLAMSIIVSVAASLVLYGIDRDAFQPQKEAGEFLAGKENVLFVGERLNGAISYKMLAEIRKDGTALDYGWVLFPAGTETEAYYDFISEPNRSDYTINQGSFSGSYIKNEIFRKDTQLTGFDYVVVNGLPNISLPEMDLVKNYSNELANVLVFEKKNHTG